MSRVDQTIEHYRSVWGDCLDIYRGDLEKRFGVPEDFEILVGAPREQRKNWTYATAGFSALSNSQIEIHLFSSVDTIETVKHFFLALSWLHNTSGCALGQAVNFGQYWLDGSLLDCGMISLPYLDGPVLEHATIEGRECSFYWLIPISKNEFEYKKKYGLEALESRFDTSGFDYADPFRRDILF